MENIQRLFGTTLGMAGIGESHAIDLISQPRIVAISEYHDKGGDVQNGLLLGRLHVCTDTGAGVFLNV